MSCGFKQPSKSCCIGGSIGGGCGRSSGFSSGSCRRYASSRASSAGGFSSRSFGGGSSRCGYGGSYGGGMSSRSYSGIGGFGCGSGGGFGGGSTGFGGGSTGFGGGTVAFGGGSIAFGGGGFGGDDTGFLSNNEKMTMQNLNERLASYLDKVRCLEEENTNLERLIREWYQTHGPQDGKDYTHYYGPIEDLLNQIVLATVANNKIILDLDNARMTAEDFRMKYETEYSLRQNVEGDINGLRPMLDNLTLVKSDLEMQFESLQEELIQLKKDHAEEIRSLQSQSGGDVSVEVNAAPGEDLMGKLNEMRKEYEYIIRQNREEVERWYESKMEEVRHEVHTSGQEIESSNQQVSELRREYQRLEIDLQSQLSMLQSLQSNLEDTERRYSMQLQQIQNMIIPVEEELASIRCEIESQNEEYKMLLGIKIRLEQEICQYRELLEEGQHDIGYIQGGGGGGGRGGRGGVSWSSAGGSGGGGGSGWSSCGGGGTSWSSGGICGGGGTGGGPCSKISGGGGCGGGNSSYCFASSSQPQPNKCEGQEGNENLRICLQGNNTLERGATMEEVTEAIKTMKSGQSRKLYA
ncbi:PREDICTED: keratin, type I cytoskeletal 14-like [Crocodylus porosus]|uniref:keratin, type I cytoskeletal 14-like n=1 Tax=Crocodylus porosus TaxID=8502 RepID=UPI00093DF0DD|nr:PREDICTED: keratin, type I cytoskeletal 14-like [Crocodylus porosus]